MSEPKQLLDTISASNARQHEVFMALHAIYHRRSFRVHCSDDDCAMVKATLAQALGRNPDVAGCPACAAGFDCTDEPSLRFLSE